MTKDISGKFILLLSNGSELCRPFPFVPYLAPDGVNITGLQYSDVQGKRSDNLLKSSAGTSDHHLRIRKKDGRWTDFSQKLNLTGLGTKEITGFQFFPVNHRSICDPVSDSDCILELYTIDSGIKPNIPLERIKQILDAYTRIVSLYKVDDWLLIIHAIRIACELQGNEDGTYHELLKCINQNLILNE